MLKEYYKKNGARCSFKDKEARYGGNKRAKTAKFDDSMQEVNTMKYHDEHIPEKKRGKKQKKNPKSDQANADPSEYERIYGIEHLDLGEPVHDS